MSGCGVLGLVLVLVVVGVRPYQAKQSAQAVKAEDQLLIYECSKKKTSYIHRYTVTLKVYNITAFYF